MSGFIELTSTQVDVARFVAFWRQFYDDSDKLYYDNINVGSDLSTENVVGLMRWKAGRFANLAEQFARAAPLIDVNAARKQAPLSDSQLRALFDTVTQQLQRQKLAVSEPLIWPVFLCHITQPDTIPIYDVNVWIAWGWIDGWIKPELYSQNPSRLDTYLRYRRWFNRLVSSGGVQPRELDRSLMAFGRYLLSDWGRPLRQVQ